MPGGEDQPTRWRPRVAAMAATAALVVAACSSGGSGSSSATTSTVVADWDRPAVVTVATDQLAVSLEVPGDWELVLDGIDGISERDLRDGCPGTVRARVHAPGVYSAVAVESVPASCDPVVRRPGNGDHGTYRTVDDATDAEAVTRVDTPAGPATRFEQPYYECTNECTTFTDTVAIVELDEPADPDHPTVVVRADKTAIGPEAFDRVLATLTSP